MACVCIQIYAYIYWDIHKQYHNLYTLGELEATHTHTDRPPCLPAPWRLRIQAAVDAARVYHDGKARDAFALPAALEPGQVGEETRGEHRLARLAWRGFGVSRLS